MTRLKQLCHWGPILTLYLIFFITFTSIFCHLVWWPPTTRDPYSILHFSVLSSWIFIILNNFFRAAFLGPGFVPYGWKPENESNTQYLQYCQICQCYKAPRSHHCRKCNRCCFKMDHHCPWINTCCGHFNHTRFVAFLTVAPMGCIHGSIVISITIYTQLYRIAYRQQDSGFRQPIVSFGIYSFLMAFFSLGLAIGVTLAVGFLLIIQLKSIFTNKTGIESWICDKADRTREDNFVYPYNLGLKRNIKDVLTWSCVPRGNGIVWPVIENCHQYTLTIEQLAQKKEKKSRTILMSIVENFSGAIFPITKGLYICISTPFTDEPRIPLSCGDRVLVTRWKRHWLYGDKILVGGDKTQRIRGWFPRRCAREEVDDDGPTLTARPTKKDQ